MASGILNNKGFTMLEVTAVLFIVGVILSMVIPSYISRINQAKYEKTVNELTALTQAAIDYYNLEGTWPDTGAWARELSPKFIAHAVISSPFGRPYNIIGVNNMVTASVLIPTGIGQKNEESPLLEIIPQSSGAQDLIKVTQIVKNEFTGRLNYCLNNLC